jgi:hypothetical protein
MECGVWRVACGVQCVLVAKKADGKETYLKQ